MDFHRVTHLPIGSENDVNLAPPGQTSWQQSIDLIQSNEVTLHSNI